jgi:anti-sigma factor RsiW
MDLEFSISQYLDGSLSPAERSALESRLASDPQARRLLEEHRKLDQMLKASPMPELRWDLLAGQISAAVAQVEIPVEAQSASRLRMNWMRMAMPMALAASVLIAAGIAIRFIPFGHSTPQGQPISAPSVAQIVGPQAEIAQGPSEISVSVGPAGRAPDDSNLARYSDDVISRPAHVTVASGINPAQDINALPFELQ